MTSYNTLITQAWEKRFPHEMAHPEIYSKFMNATRVAVLTLIKLGSRGSGAISWETGLTPNASRYHLRELAKKKMIMVTSTAQERVGSSRPVKIFVITPLGLVVQAYYPLIELPNRSRRRMKKVLQ